MAKTRHELGVGESNNRSVTMSWSRVACWRGLLTVIVLGCVHPLLASSPPLASVDCTNATPDARELCAAARLYMDRNAVSEIQISFAGAPPIYACPHSYSPRIVSYLSCLLFLRAECDTAFAQVMDQRWRHLIQIRVVSGELSQPLTVLRISATA